MQDPGYHAGPERGSRGRGELAAGRMRTNGSVNQGGVEMRHRTMLFGLIFLSLLLVVTPVARPSTSSFTFTVPSATYYTAALGVNKAGSIVGIYADNNGLHGFVHRGSDFSTGFSAINVPNSFLTEAQGINDRGDVVGLYLDNSGTHGFVHHGLDFSTGYQKIDVPSAACCVAANGINKQGEIVGTYVAKFHTHGFVHRGTDYSTGYSTLDVPGAADTFLNGISRNGEIVGQYVASGTVHGFAVRGGVFTTLDAPSTLAPAPIPNTTALTGVNGRGVFVGYYADFGGQLDGLMGQGSTFQPVSISGSTLTLPYGINDKGKIVGVASVGGLFYGFVTGGSVSSTGRHGDDDDASQGDDDDSGQGDDD